MNIVLLSGGSGKRLWPLSNDVRSKQFIKILKRPDGTFESMVQRMYRNIKALDEKSCVVIATSKSQVSEINNQLGQGTNISVEPCRRDTFPAIALAVAYLHDVLKISQEETVVICPVDPLVEQDYFLALQDLERQASKLEANIVLMGIEPTYPSSKYGYILPENKNCISHVISFKEKPSEDEAKMLIDEGALWNGGVFALKLSYILKKAFALLGYSDYLSLLHNFDSFEKNSIDYAVVEKEKDIQVLRFSGLWKDLGTWNTLSEAVGNESLGKVIDTKTNSNVTIVNELDIPILPMGLHDIVISASPEGILVSDKMQSSYIKPFVDKIEQRTMFAEKSWGSFQIIDAEKESLTIKIVLTQGNGMHYHFHQHRDENWTIVEGTGYAIINGVKKDVGTGDNIFIKSGIPHTIFATSCLKIIETQIGKDISIADKVKVNLDAGLSEPH